MPDSCKKEHLILSAKILVEMRVFHHYLSYEKINYLLVDKGHTHIDPLKSCMWGCDGVAMQMATDTEGFHRRSSCLTLGLLAFSRVILSC